MQGEAKEDKKIKTNKNKKNRIKSQKNATISEGESQYDIAQRIWGVSDAYDEMYTMMTTNHTHIQRYAGVGAIIARVFALAFQSTDSGDIAAYQKFFFFLGKLRIRSGCFHHAVWRLANWGGLEVEIDNAQETGEAEDRPFNTCSYLSGMDAALRCNDLLQWFVQWKYNASPWQHNHLSGKLDDYTNFLLRWDAGVKILITGPQNLKRHKGDFAAYMKKRMENQITETPISEIFNPMQHRLVHGDKIYKLDAHKREPTDSFGNWAVLGKYKKDKCADHGLGVFNPYHSFDQLDHSGIDKAMSGYAAGSNMFWGLFVLDCLCVVQGVQADTDIIKERAEKCRNQNSWLPITDRFVDIALQLALQFATGSSGQDGHGIPAMRDPYTMSPKKVPQWWKEWEAPEDSWPPHRPFLPERKKAPVDITDPSDKNDDGAPGEDVPRRSGDSDEDTQNSGAAGEGNSVPSHSDITRKTVVKSLVHTTRLLERMHIDETLWNELSEENDRVDIKTPAFARVAQLRSGDSHAEPDEVNQRSFSRPGIVNCTTPTAFARAEHREPMCNHFYS